MGDKISKERAGVILIKNKKILLMLRRKRGEEYYIVPGGSIEAGEAPEQAAKREAREELTLNVKLVEKLWEYTEEDGYLHHYYMANSDRYEAVLGGEEAELSNPNNYFDLHWIDLDMLHSLNFRSPALKKKIINKFIQ